MSAEKKPLLNASAVENRIAKLGLRKVQVAVETGVHRKTVGRWLDGRTTRIRLSNLKRLAQTLEIPVEGLVAESETEVLASRDDQARVAHLIEKERLLEVLVPHSRWPHLITFVNEAKKADLPLSVFGKLLNFLAQACLRQNRFQSAEAHAREAMELGERIDNHNVVAGAHLNLGALAAIRGSFEQASEQYRACIARSQHLAGTLNQATALSGLAGTYDAIGELEMSETLGRKAVALLRRLRRPAELSDARRNLGFARIEMNRLDDAEKTLLLSVDDAKSVDWLTGAHLALLGLAEVAARRGNFDRADSLYDRCLQGFDSPGVENGLDFEVGARIARFEGRFDYALDCISRGLEYAAEFPYRRAKLHVERMSIAVATGERETEKGERKKAIALFNECGAFRRATALRFGG